MQKYILAALLGTASAIKTSESEDAWPEHKAGLAEEDAWPSLAEEETASTTAGFVPEYSHKECAGVVPMDEWKNAPAAGSGGCKTQYFWAEQGPGGIAPVAQENHRHQYCREQNWRMKPYLKERNWTVETCSEKCKSSEGCHAFFMGRDDSSGQHGKCLLFPKCDSFYHNVDWDYYLNKEEPPKCGWECMVQTNEPPKPKPAGLQPICVGLFSSMTKVHGWSYTHPLTKTAEDCSARCAGNKDCKYFIHNDGDQYCFAYSAYSGHCNPNKDYKFFVQPTKAAAKPAAPEVLCNGGYASMNGVGNWNYETPHTGSAEACLERCAGRSDCKYIRYNYKNNNCFAYKDRSGKCYPNDHDHIYARDGKQV